MPNCCFKFNGAGDLAARVCASGNCPAGWDAVPVSDCDGCASYPGAAADDGGIHIPRDTTLDRVRDLIWMMEMAPGIMEKLGKLGWDPRGPAKP